MVAIESHVPTKRVERWRDGHKFLYVFRLDCHRSIMRQIAADAMDPEHPLTWQVASELLTEIRYEVLKAWLFGHLRRLRK